MCLLGYAFYHCHNWRERFVFHDNSPAVPRDTAGVCAICSMLIMDVIIHNPQTRVYMLLREGLLILSILGQT